jgi:hypothetical protein
MGHRACKCVAHVRGRSGGTFINWASRSQRGLDHITRPPMFPTLRRNDTQRSRCSIAFSSQSAHRSRSPDPDSRARARRERQTSFPEAAGSPALAYARDCRCIGPQACRAGRPPHDLSEIIRPNCLSAKFLRAKLQRICADDIKASRRGLSCSQPAREWRTRSPYRT